ncbi:MAG: transposase [Lentisphaerota bacterium]
MDFFTRKELNRMAKETGFTERSSPIDGFSFALTFTTGFLNTPEGTLYLIDSTNFTLHESLKIIFKGPGGNASEAMVRIQFVYDYVTGGMFVEIGDVKTADAPTLEAIVRNVKVPCDGPTLFIADLGYFKVVTYRMIALGELQFFLSKLKLNTTILDEWGNKIDIKKIMRAGFDLTELKICMGGIWCRLLLQKLPDEVVNRKLRGAK